jgi:hypothetical protein
LNQRKISQEISTLPSKASTMFQATAQSIIKKSPQQATRIHTATRTVATGSFAFYPVQRNRVRLATTQKSNRECFSFYLSNAAERHSAAAPVVQSVYNNDVNAIRAALMKNKNASNKPLKKNWDSIMETMRDVRKATVALP